jgi:Protein of unknown function (DUF3237)
MAAPDLELLFTLTADTTLTGMIANGPMGTRVIVDASTGTFEGPRLRGTVSGPGGDWVTVRADGSMHLDVRILLKTDDGADIYCEYKGIGLDGATKITTAPMFQTAHESYTWLNDVVAIARGTSGGGQVTYEVYEVK